MCGAVVPLLLLAAAVAAATRASVVAVAALIRLQRAATRSNAQQRAAARYCLRLCTSSRVSFLCVLYCGVRCVVRGAVVPVGRAVPIAIVIDDANAESSDELHSAALAVLCSITFYLRSMRCNVRHRPRTFPGAAASFA